MKNYLSSSKFYQYRFFLFYTWSVFNCNEKFVDLLILKYNAYVRGGYVTFVYSEFPTTQRRKKMACIPVGNRNVFFLSDISSSYDFRRNTDRQSQYPYVTPEDFRSRDQHRGIVSVNRGILRLRDTSQLYTGQTTKEQ